VDIYILVGLAVTALVVGFAFIKGDEPERLGGAAFVMVSLAGSLSAHGGMVTGPRWGLIGLDFVLLSVFLWLAWHTRRTWLVWASAFQSLIVTGHLLLLANIRPPGGAFAAVNNMANYGLLIAIAVGTFWAWQERRAAGVER
jgi:hydrogenase/urease accessory protein HupE